MKDIVAFMRWDRLVPWKVFSLKEYPDKLLVPIGFGAKYWDFYNLLEPGSNMWVITRIANKHSLAARIKVQDVLDGNSISEEQWPSQAVRLLKIWRFVATADIDNSEFFETNNATPVLKENNIRFDRNHTLVYRDKSLEDIFSTCMKQGRRIVFISYRWKEAKKFAKRLARQLRREGFSPWLDALALPEYEADRETDKDAPRLNRLIKSGIERSKYAIVLNTKTYGASYWTKEEADYINEKGIPKLRVDVNETKGMKGDSNIFAMSPNEIVRELQNLMPTSLGE